MPANEFNRKVKNIVYKAQRNHVNLSHKEIFSCASKIASYTTNPKSKVTKREATICMSKLGA